MDTPPRGQGNSVHATWGQHSSSLLCYLSYAGLGSGTNWTLGYSSYVDTGSGSGNRAVFDGTGNRTTHIYNSGGTFDRQLLTQQTLEKVYSGSTFSGFRLKSEDGSYEEYRQPGKEALPSDEKRYFLTKEVDVQGVTIRTITYETGSLQRISTISGVAGTATLTFSYWAYNDYKIYGIADNRTGASRACSFYYDSWNRLQTIYDVMGIASPFNYDGSFLSSLTTPYGISNFSSTSWSSGANWGRYLNLTDPRGWTQRVLYSNALPSAGFAGDSTLAYEIPDPPISFVKTSETEMKYGASWHWDKQMYNMYPPGDPSLGVFTNFDKAIHTSWMQSSYGVSTGVPASVRSPNTSSTNSGGNRTFFVYKGQSTTGILADTNLLQTKVRKVWAWNPAIGAEDEMNQVHSYTYNSREI